MPYQVPNEKRKVTIYPSDSLQSYQYVVIFARHQDQWLYCRAKTREGYETAGGHIEPGETPMEAARRELYEETGALGFDIRLAFDYAVHRGENTSNGQLYLAYIQTLGDMPNYEMAELLHHDTYPEILRFPDILPVLYAQLQMWLNLQTAPDEMWDIYDENRQKTGRIHRRGDLLPPGDRHLVVYVWLLNTQNQLLITKRSANKGYPGIWECTGGSALAGDDSLTAALREMQEETGLTLNPDCGQCVLTLKRPSAFDDVWLFRQDIPLNQTVLQPDEVAEARYASPADIRRMVQAGEFLNFSYLEELFALLDG